MISLSSAVPVVCEILYSTPSPFPGPGDMVPLLEQDNLIAFLDNLNGLLHPIHPGRSIHATSHPLGEREGEGGREGGRNGGQAMKSKL